MAGYWNLVGYWNMAGIIWWECGAWREIGKWQEYRSGKLTVTAQYIFFGGEVEWPRYNFRSKFWTLFLEH